METPLAILIRLEQSAAREENIARDPQVSWGQKSTKREEARNGGRGREGEPQQ